jgi:tetratricopeptide (TPR) repeat protein
VALAILAHHRFNPWEGSVAIHDLFVAANMKKGMQAFANHNPAEAAESFRRAMQYPEDLGTGEPSAPDNAEQIYWLGNALQAQGKTAEATATWNRATAQGTIFSALADKKLGLNEKAAQILDRCIKIAGQPDATAKDYLVAGLAERYSGNLERAQADFQRALRMDPLLWQARTALDRMSRAGGNSK